MAKNEFRKRDSREERAPKEFEEHLVQLDRISYVVAGGKRMRFRALVVIGNKNGKVGFGLAKALEVPKAVQKAVTMAKKNIIEVPIVRETIAYPIQVKFGSAVVLLKPAPSGTSVKAGGAVRIVLEHAGVKNVTGKILGSPNKINNVKATIEALRRLNKYAITQAKDNK